MLSIVPNKSVAPAVAPAAKPRAEETAEHRCAPRLPASAVPSITGLRIPSNGPEAVLINISSGGLLAECSERLQPGSKLTVLVEGTFVPKVIRGRVARNLVAALGANGRLRYHIGIAFEERIDLQAEPTEETVAPASAAEPSAPPSAAPAGPPVLRNRW